MKMIHGTRKSDHIGFSLIEMLVAGLIMAVLTSIAVPSYQTQQINRSRLNAQVQLAALLLEIETLRGAFPGAVIEEVIDLHDTVSDASSLKRYRFVLSPNPLRDSVSYHLMAQPIGPQKGDGGLTLTHLGEGCRHKTDAPLKIASGCLGETW